ncbi:hypothetical protein [Yinghuangia sp. YIM S09857]|uniref:hypothetical protein n=1 Tax=Yinghuangia sp. YIM S09857 TaxID=3436929 RepID=UPI003F529650
MTKPKAVPMAAEDPLGYWTAAEFRSVLKISKWSYERLRAAGLPVIQPSPKVIRIPIGEARAWLAENSLAA